MSLGRKQSELTRHFGLQVACARIVTLARLISEKTGEPIPAGKSKRNAFLTAYHAEHVKGSPMPKSKTARKAKRASGKLADQQFYDSDAWRELRYRVLKMHGAKCQCCGATARSSRAPIHVDHIKPRSKHPELELEFTNLQVLCRDCNLGKRAWDETDWRPKLEAA